MQFYLFSCIIYFLVAKTDSKVTEKEYGLMPQLFYMDDYDRCLMLGEKALFCSVTVQLTPVKYNYSKVWAIIEDVISYEKNFRHDILRHSICVPSHCPQIGNNASNYINDVKYLQREISKCYTKKYTDLGLLGNVTEINCESDKLSYEVDGCDVFVGLCLFSLLVVLVFASCYEGLARYKSKEEYKRIINSKGGKIITCFSLPKNWERLTATNTSLDAQVLKAINGFRFYTIFLVVFAHTCMLAFASYSSNPQFEERMTSDPLNMIFINGSFSMQTFLLISGILLSYYFFVSIDKIKHFKFSYVAFAFVNRYIRLTTSLVVMIGITATWLRHLNKGPSWGKVVGDEFRNCRMHWWANLLYINNYYDVQHMCLLQTWYLAADTQLYTISLIILMVIWKYKKYTMTILCASLIIGCAVPTVITYIYSYDILIREYPETLYKVLLDSPEWTVMLIPGHMNIGGYTIGLIAGYFIYKTRGKKIVLKKRYVVLWWILIWSLPLSVIYLGIPMYDDNFVYSRLGASLYQGFGRNIFAIGTCLGILGINQNIGWFLRDAVLWAPLQILGRLTYCVFLVHTAIIRVRSGQSRSLNYLSSYNFFAQAASDLVLSFICGLLLCLAVELPTSALQRLMMSRFRKEENNYSKNNVNEDEDTKV